MKFLFLYTEIAEYFLACCRQLAQHGEVHIIRWPINKEAPFKFDENKNLTIYSKSDYDFKSLKKLVESINPDIIICSGWIDKDYLKLTKPYFRKIPTVMTCDTHWRGDIKQQLAVVASRFTLLNIFTHAWVPGEAQKKYVLKLGFKNENIEMGFYSCDLTYFDSIYQSQKLEKQINFPKRFLYVGRYYEFKGINELWQAFIDLQTEQPNEWELWCLGIGDVLPIQHPKIKHFGFVQPSNLPEFIAQTGVFILPSRFEPWGVVVHEFAASGFPLLLSDKVGAKEQFLRIGKNGYEFQSENKIDIKEKLKIIVNTPVSELSQMSVVSHELSKTISPKKWVNSALKMLGKNN